MQKNDTIPNKDDTEELGTQIFNNSKNIATDMGQIRIISNGQTFPLHFGENSIGRKAASYFCSLRRCHDMHWSQFYILSQKNVNKLWTKVAASAKNRSIPQDFRQESKILNNKYKSNRNYQNYNSNYNNNQYKNRNNIMIIINKVLFKLRG